MSRVELNSERVEAKPSGRVHRRSRTRFEYVFGRTLLLTING